MPDQFSASRIEHLVDCLSPSRLTRVVDVGANPINGNPYGRLFEAGLCQIWGFEPEDAGYERLKSSENANFLPFAVGDGSRKTLNICRSVSLSSLLVPDPVAAEYFARFRAPTTIERSIVVETRRLDDLDEIPEFDLLKIDVQGAEIQVFGGATRKLQSACAVITEVAFMPLYEDQPLLDAQMAALRDLGMDFHKFLFLKGFSLRGGLNTQLSKKGHANQLLDGDAVFIRSLRKPETSTVEQLKHLSILADAVFESFDLAVRCLDLLIERKAIAPSAAKKYVELVPDA